MKEWMFLVQVLVLKHLSYIYNKLSKQKHSDIRLLPPGSREDNFSHLLRISLITQLKHPPFDLRQPICCGNTRTPVGKGIRHAQWSFRKIGTIGTLQWSGWKARCLERDTEGIEGYRMRKGVSSPGRIRSLGNVMCSPAGSGEEPDR